ncbi:MAG: hypothetical protein M1834_007439 [Cirrosporium novae-zelandiae]|nr:MAG: hypothetical protein M1834_007439 [Cirrosporium novae-zelandiae]
MGLGIREPNHKGEGRIPGTLHLYDDDSIDSNEGPDSPELNRNVKHAGSSSLILFPQPSESLNDPLNWSQWKKDLTLFSICFAAGIGALLGPLLSPVNAILAEEYGVSINEASELQGYPLFMSACGAVVFSAFSRVWGKRPVYLFAIILIFASTLWIIWNGSFKSFLGARILYGFGLGAYEGIVTASIGDMFFVHQRGTRVTIYTLWLLGCTNFAPVIGGYISLKHGWRMQFKISAIFVGIAVLLVTLFCPETAYGRPKVFETDITSDTSILHAKDEKGEIKTTTTSTTPAGSNSDAQSDEPQRTWTQELQPFSGRYSNDNLFKLLARPFICMLYPAVLFGFLVIGVMTAWAVGVAITMAQVFSVPPASFNSAQLGYTFTFAAVGCATACIFGSVALDPLSKYAARRNNRILEPEFRIILTIVVYIFAIPGIFSFGYYATTPHPHWVVVSILYGLIDFGDILSASISCTYVLDCHRDYAVEMTVGLQLLRNFFSFAASYFLPNWLENSGTRRVYYSMGGIECAMFVVCFFMYVFGKCLRNFVHRHSPLRFFHLE